MKFRPLLTSIAIAALGLPLAGQATLAQVVPAAPVVNHDPGKVPAGKYMVDPYHTEIIFGISHLGFTTYYGWLSNPSGSLLLRPKKPASSMLEITFPTDALTTPSFTLTHDLAGPAWFDAAKYPTVTFKSTRIRLTGKGEAAVTGKLTLHGVTKPVTMHVTFVGSGIMPVLNKETVGFSATATIRRSDFGVSGYVPLVGDDVDLTIAGAFVKDK